MNVHNHDKLTRYDTQHDPSLYDVRARSRIIKPEDVAAIISADDTLNISSDKIKEDALIRLLHTSDFMGNNVIASMLIRIAKYLFVAIAWPPYTIAYTLPKWIFLQGLPILMKFLNEAMNKFQKNFQTLINPISESFVLAYKKIERLIKGFILEPIFRSVKNIVRRNLDKGLGFAQKIVYKVRNKISDLFSISQATRDLPPRIIEIVKVIVDKTIEKIKTPFLKIRQPMKAGLKFVQSISSNLIQQVAAQLQPSIPGWMIIPLQQFSLKFDTAQNLAEQATNWLSQLISSKVVSRLTSAVEVFHTILKRMHSEALLQLKRFGSFLGNRGKQVFQWMNKNKQQALEIAQKLSKKVLTRIFSWLPRFIRLALIKLAYHPVTQSFLKGLLKGVKELGVQIAKLPAATKNLVIEQVKLGMMTVKKGIQAIIQFGTRVIILSTRVINRTIYWVLSILIMSGIVSGWAIQLLAKVTMWIAQWIRWPRLAG